jgi:signal transduction histidine kinase
VELPTVEHRLRAVTMLQQQAHSLAGETARRARADERLRDALAAERAARLEAEAALRLRDEFLTVAAHELKTPLTGLAGRVQLLLRQFVRDGQLQPERVTRGLAAISVQAEKLSKLLNQLLDITRLESGQLALDRRPVDVVPLVEQVVFDMTGDDARCVVALDAPSSLAGDIDPLRLEQVLTNLLDNAIKYSPDGASIDVAVARTSRGTIELSVRDRGPGIPPERRARIFERYYQAHDDSVRPGLGLGLYISHQIVELHGGEIRAEFPPDGGARFVVHLPPALDTSPTSRAAD